MNFDDRFISFVIPLINPGALDLNSLNSIITQDRCGLEFEIILVNNSSEKLDLDMPDVKVIEELKAGPQHARNAGIRAAKGRYLAFIDCDVILEKDWLVKMISSLKGSSAWGAQSALVSTSKTRTFFGQFRELSSKLSYDGLIMSRHYFPVINTSACLYDRTRTGHISFHDLFRKCEDVELSWRLYRSAGCSWNYVSEAKAYCYYGPENFLVFMNRNFHLGRYYGGLVETYKNQYPKMPYWHRKYFKESLKELFRVLKSSPEPALVPRVAMTLAYWAGFFLRPVHLNGYSTIVPELPPKRFTYVNQTLIIHDLSDGSSVTRHLG